MDGEARRYSLTKRDNGVFVELLKEVKKAFSFQKKRGVQRTQKRGNILVARVEKQKPKREICEQLQMNKYSSVSSVIERMESLVAKPQGEEAG